MRLPQLLQALRPLTRCGSVRLPPPTQGEQQYQEYTSKYRL